MAARFVITKTSNGRFRCVLHAASGQPVAASETYTTKSAAKKGIISVKGELLRPHGSTMRPAKVKDPARGSNGRREP